MNIAIGMDGVLAKLYESVLRLHSIEPKHAYSMPTGGSIAEVIRTHALTPRTMTHKRRAAQATEEAVWATVAAQLPSWWERLAPDPNGVLLASKLLVRGIDVFPIAAPLLLGRNDDGYAASSVGRRRWLERHLPMLSRRLVLATEAHRCANPGTLLIDDVPERVAAWRSAGGPAVLWYQPWNRRSSEHLMDERSRVLHAEAERTLPEDLGPAQRPL
jgi:hypothetical protein